MCKYTHTHTHIQTYTVRVVALCCYVSSQTEVTATAGPGPTMLQGLVARTSHAISRMLPTHTDARWEGRIWPSISTFSSRHTQSHFETPTFHCPEGCFFLWYMHQCSNSLRFRMIMLYTCFYWYKNYTRLKASL